MPKSCAECYLEAFTVKDDDIFEEIVTKFYIPVYRDCVVDGNITA